MCVFAANEKWPLRRRLAVADSARGRNVGVRSVAGAPWRPELRTVSPPTFSFVFTTACTVSVLDCVASMRLRISH